MDNPNLKYAIGLSAKYHSGQTDKANKPYILHPIRVMLKLQSIEEKIVGILHDIVEDTEYTLNQMKDDGFSEEIIGAVKLLTKTKKGDFDIKAYYQNIFKNKLAKNVKLADLEDNMDLSRIQNPIDSDFERVKKYQKYYQYLKFGDSSYLI